MIWIISAKLNEHFSHKFYYSGSEALNGFFSKRDFLSFFFPLKGNLNEFAQSEFLLCIWLVQPKNRLKSFRLVFFTLKLRKSCVLRSVSFLFLLYQIYPL